MNLRNDDYQYLGLLLEGIEGSLSEERQQSRGKNYNRINNSLFHLNKKYNLSVTDIQLFPDLIQSRLAEIAALFPTYTVDFRLCGIGKIQGKGQYNKLKNILIFLATSDIPEWLKIYFEEPILRLIPKQIEEGIISELQFLSQIFVMEKSQRIDILNKIYSSNNLRSQEEAGLKLLYKHFFFSFFPSGNVKETQRKRGYSDKGSTSLRSEKERRKCMTEIESTFEERKQRIKLKQLEIFERNLDKILEISSLDSRKEVKNIIRNQNEQINKIINPKETGINGREMEKQD